jgi:1-acyl-sn-glycerol-3-phosphate acyltransferase
MSGEANVSGVGGQVSEKTEAPRIPSDARHPTPGAFTSILAHAARLWYSVLYGPCFALSKLLFRFRFAGKSNVPMTGPVLIVSNHQSNLDPVLIGLASPRQLKFFARVGLFFWPFSWWIRALGAVPIDRANAVGGIKTTLKLLKNGEAVVVFPEGSRTYDGKMGEMQAGFCMLARRSGATIVPVAIDGAFAALRRGSIMPRLAEITLVICPPVTSREIGALSDGALKTLVVERISGALSGGIFAEHSNGSP